MQDPVSFFQHPCNLSSLQGLELIIIRLAVLLVYRLGTKYVSTPTKPYSLRPGQREGDDGVYGVYIAIS